MNQRQQYRNVMRTARGLAQTPIDETEAKAAIDMVRRILKTAASREMSGTFARRWLWLSAGIAAGMAVIAIIAMVVVTLPRPADAAEQLRAASRATNSFQGWVHVTLDISQEQTGIARLLAPNVHLHFNNASGDFAIEFNVFGSECITFFAADVGKEMEYVALSGEMQVSPMSKRRAEELRQSIVAFPLDPEDVIAKSKTQGRPDPRVTKSADGGLDRFDADFKRNSSTRPDSNRDSSIDSMTIWADSQTKLIRKMVTTQNGKPLTMTFSYGEPAIRDIYDLGAPRDAKVVEMNPPADEIAPAVMTLPDTTWLVKDKTASVADLEARLRNYAAAPIGDFAAVDCEQLAIPGRSVPHGMITLIASQGEKGFNDRFEVAPTLAFLGGAPYPNGWPTPKLADVLACARRAYHDSIVVYNGGNIFGDVTSYTTDKTGKMHAVPATQVSAALAKSMRTSGLDLSKQVWPNLDGSFTFTGQRPPTLQILRDPKRPNLIVLHVKQDIPAFTGSTTQPIFFSEDYYWLDPQRDDLPIESLDFNSMNSDATGHTVYLAFAQLADGRWYPTHWHSRTIFPPKDGPSEPGYYDNWRQIWQNPKLDDRWFTDPAGRLKRLQSLFPAAQPGSK